MKYRVSLPMVVKLLDVVGLMTRKLQVLKCSHSDRYFDNPEYSVDVDFSKEDASPLVSEELGFEILAFDDHSKFVEMVKSP